MRGDALAPERRRPRQPHPGTRIIRYRCFLPDLAGFANYRRGGTDGATIEVGIEARDARRLNSRRPSRCIWRRERDSNPRYGDKPYTHFPGVLLQPLGHLSARVNRSCHVVTAKKRKHNGWVRLRQESDSASPRSGRRRCGQHDTSTRGRHLVATRCQGCAIGNAAVVI
jgi:hypothetical protein